MHRLVVAVVALVSIVWTAAATAAPQITNVIPGSGPTAGGTSITIVGSGFDAAGNLVAVGGSPCPVTEVALDRLVCTLPAGSGASRPIRVVDGGGQASPPFPFGYDTPSITSITASSFPTAGGSIITITGQNFGAAGTSRHITVTVSICGEAQPTIDHVQLQCRLPPGEGLDVPVEVEVDGQRSSAPGHLSYDPPAITAVAPTRGSAAGGVRLTIHGQNFGSASAITVGGSSCSDVLQSQTQLECTSPPASGAPPDVRVTAGGQASNSFPFSNQMIVSKCDAAKFKAAASLAQCLLGTESKGDKKGIAADAVAVAKCDDKFTASCTKAETKLDDCTQVGTCSSILKWGHSSAMSIIGNIRG